jgi:hypothetical protein
VTWDAFLRGTDKSLRIAALGFFIGMAAAGVGFLAAWADVRWMGMARGVSASWAGAVCMFGILRSWVMMLRGRRGQ